MSILNTLTPKDFKLWFDGFVAGKDTLSPYDLEILKKKVAELCELEYVAPTNPPFYPTPGPKYPDTNPYPGPIYPGPITPYPSPWVLHYPNIIYKVTCESGTSVKIPADEQQSKGNYK